MTKLEGLETLEALEELYLSHNGIQKLEGLEHNTNLTTLDFGANQVQVIENIKHLTKLTQFWVCKRIISHQANDNQITDINQLEEHLGPLFMPELETVYLEGNPAQKSEGASYRRKVQLLLPQIKQLDATYVYQSSSHIQLGSAIVVVLYSTKSNAMAEKETIVLSFSCAASWIAAYDPLGANNTSHSYPQRAFLVHLAGQEVAFQCRHRTRCPGIRKA